MLSAQRLSIFIKIQEVKAVLRNLNMDLLNYRKLVSRNLIGTQFDDFEMSLMYFTYYTYLNAKIKWPNLVIFV